MITTTKDNTKCIFAHGGMSISTNGYTKPCCQIKKGEGEKPHWSEDHNESQWWASLRDNLDNGIKDSRCVKCWDLEASGIQSMRLCGNEFQEEDKVNIHPWSYVDLKLGSKCNLMCSMCKSPSSSLIAKEMYDNMDEQWPGELEEGLFPSHHEEFKKQTRKYYELGGFTEKKQWYEDPAFYDKLKSNAEHIRTLKFTGGEPTVIPQVHEVMDWMVKSGHAKHIHIRITTNGTNKSLKLWEDMLHFRSSQIRMSVDGTGANYNYIRYPHSWEQWQQNIKQLQLYKGEIKLNYQFTMSAFNLFNIVEMSKWFHEVGGCKSYRGGYTLHPVFWPRHHNVRYLPDDVLEKALIYLKEGQKKYPKMTTTAINFIESRPYISIEEKNEVMQKLKQDTLIKDKLRVKRPNYDSIDTFGLRRIFDDIQSRGCQSI